MNTISSPLHAAGRTSGLARHAGIQPHLPSGDTFAAGLAALDTASGQPGAASSAAAAAAHTAGAATPAAATAPGASANATARTAEGDPQVREAFDQFVGETFYGQMLKSLRSTTKKPAYFNGGRAEEVFTGQLDQVMAQKISHVKAQQISQPMFSLYNLQRK